VVGCQPPTMMSSFTGGDDRSFPSMTIPMRGLTTEGIVTCHYHQDPPLGRLVRILIFVYFIFFVFFDLISAKQKCKYFWYGIIY
jgi:hypothetical protein